MKYSPPTWLKPQFGSNSAKDKTSKRRLFFISRMLVFLMFYCNNIPKCFQCHEFIMRTKGCMLFEFSFSTLVMITYVTENCTPCAQCCKSTNFYWTHHSIQKAQIKKTTYIYKKIKVKVHEIHNECSVPRPPPKEGSSTCSITLLNKPTLGTHASPSLPPIL